MALCVFKYELRRAGEVVKTGDVKATNVWHALDQLTQQLWSPQHIAVEEFVIRRDNQDVNTGK